MRLVARARHVLQGDGERERDGKERNREERKRRERENQRREGRNLERLTGPSPVRQAFGAVSFINYLKTSIRVSREIFHKRQAIYLRLFVLFPLFAPFGRLLQELPSLFLR